MTLTQWEKNGWIRPHQTSPQEIAGLLSIVERDLLDAQGRISADWQFGITYNAALNVFPFGFENVGGGMRILLKPSLRKGIGVHFVVRNQVLFSLVVQVEERRRRTPERFLEKRKSI